MHHATYNGNVQILERIWKWDNEQLSKEEINKLLLAQDNNRKTAWNMAVQKDKVEVLEKLWEWAKEVLNRDELNNKILLATNDEEKTALHHFTLGDSMHMLE